MLLIGLWTLLLAVASSDVVSPTSTSRRADVAVRLRRLPVEDALQRLAGIVHHLKSLGLSDDVIKSVVDANLERPDQKGVDYVAGGSRRTPDPGDVSPRDTLPLANPRCLMNPERRQFFASDSERVLNPLLRVLLTYPSPSRHRRKYKNRRPQDKSAADRANPATLAALDRQDRLQPKRPRVEKARLFNGLASALEETDQEGIFVKTPKNIENPLPPLKGVVVEMASADGNFYKQTVALSPGLSVYRAIYQAALHYDSYDGAPNPFDVSIEPDSRRRCYVISGISGYDDGANDRWRIVIRDGTGQVKYEGPCLVPNSKLPLRSGYTIQIHREPPNE